MAWNVSRDWRGESIQHFLLIVDWWPKMEYSENPWLSSRSLLLRYVLSGVRELSGRMMSRYDDR